MSKQDLQEFVRVSLAKPTIAAQLEATNSTTALLERAIALGKENGYSFTEGEFAAWISNRDDAAQNRALEDIRERAPYF